MSWKQQILVYAVGLMALFATDLSAQLYHGLDQMGPVQSSGSDTRAANFNSTHLQNVLDYTNNHLEEWVPPIKGKNISSTPWLGDLDNDGSLDMVYCLQANSNDIYSYYGIRLIRMDLGIPDSKTQSQSLHLCL